MSTPIHLVCSQCDSVLRIPSDRLQEGPRCPKCRQPVFDGHPIELSRENFDKHVGRSDLPVVVDFWAPWCGPCRMMAPHFETVAQRLSTAARFAKVNTENEPALGQRFAIRSIPTLSIFRGGNELIRQPGAMDANGLVRWLAQAGIGAG